MNQKLYDLTEGEILKKLFLVAVPIMGTQLMQMAYNLTDMFWLGRMETSVTAVAASGLAGLFLWLSVAFMMVGRTGSEIGTAQNLGRKDPDTARAFAENSARISMILGVAYGTILIVLAAPLVSLLQVKEELLFAETCAYLRIVGLGIPFAFVSGSITGAFNGAGNSRLSFRANALGLIVNMILDPFMILYLGWGVRGAAIATVIAEALVLALFICYAKGHKNRPFAEFKLAGKIYWDKTKVTLNWSIPLALESGAFTLLSMVVTAMAAAWYGEIAVAVHRVGTQIESLSWLIGVGFSSAVTAFVGQNFGAGRWQRIRRAYKISLVVLMIWEIFVTMLLITGGRFLFAIFLSDPPGIANLGGTYLKILAVSQVFMTFEAACSGAFRGMGKTLPPSLCSIISNLLRPLLCWFFVQWMGMNGLWMGITVSAVLRGLSMLIWYTIYQRNHIPLEKDSKLFDFIAPAYGLFFNFQVRMYKRHLKKAKNEISFRGCNTVLDIGSGTGALCKVLKDEGFQVVGTEISKEMLKIAEKKLSGENIELMNADVISGLPFPEGSFDLVISSFVAHGLDANERAKMYGEMKRLSKGLVVLIDYNDKRSIITSFVETLEGGDYFNFIEKVQDELRGVFEDLKVVDAGARSSWYVASQTPSGCRRLLDSTK